MQLCAPICLTLTATFARPKCASLKPTLKPLDAVSCCMPAVFAGGSLRWQWRVSANPEWSQCLSCCSALRYVRVIASTLSHLLALVAHCCRGGSQFVQSDSLASLRHLMCTIHLRRPTPFGVLQKAMSSQFRVIMTDTKPAVYLSTFASIDDMCVVLQHTAHASKSNQFALTQFAAPVRDSDAHAWT